MRPRRPAAVCLVMLAARSSAAAGADKVDEVIEELFLGEAAYPQDALELQVTADLGGARTGDTTRAGAELEVEFGITDRLQIAAIAPLEWVSMDMDMERRAGLGNLALEVLYNPVSNRRLGLAVSAGFEVSFPSVSSAGEDAWGVEAFAAAYKVLGRVHVNLTVAAELSLPSGPMAEREVSPAGALGVFTPIGRWVPVLELRAAGEETPAVVLSAGTLWHPVDDLELGAAVRVGLDTRSIGGLVTATVEIELAED